MKRDDRMPTPEGVVLSGLITAACVVVVSAMWVTNRAHLAWIDAQARVQALGVRLGDAMDQIGIYDGDLDE